MADGGAGDSLQLALTVVSPWQWFCSTRTFSNCVETTLTVVALYLWPWQWQWSVAVSAGAGAGAGHQSKGNHEVTDHGILTRYEVPVLV